MIDPVTLRRKEEIANMGEARLCLKQYDDKQAEKWDQFIAEEAVNGTFLQSRRFLSYHPKDRFEDCSLLIYDAAQIAAVIPACVMNEDGKKTFYSHKGSTFGGIVIGQRYYKLKYMLPIFELLDAFFKEESFEQVYMRQTGSLFCRQDPSLLDYFLFHEQYEGLKELSIYVDLRSDSVDTIYQGFDDRKKRNFRISLKHDLTFRMLRDSEISDFHSILTNNLQKYKTKPIHTVNELQLLKSLFPDKICFYGAFFERELVAACMCFDFDGVVLHTQNPCMDYDHKDKRVMEFLHYCLIKTAFEKRFSYYSFGISTENMGRQLNLSLATFKESFAGQYKCNIIYKKLLT